MEIFSVPTVRLSEVPSHLLAVLFPSKLVDVSSSHTIPVLYYSYRILSGTAEAVETIFRIYRA